MNAYSDELRLAWLVTLNIGLFAAAYRFARGWGTGGAVQALCDAFLLYFLAQYAAVALPGVVGQFNSVTMTGVAILATAILWFSGSAAYLYAEKKAPSQSILKPGADPTITLDHFALIAATLFVAGFLVRYAKQQWPIPPVATDALVYHLPTAVQWMQTGRLGIYPTWYWNPAASYSPGTGSIFMAWWMTPVRSDVFVRFVQLPPLMFIFFLVVRMCRLVGCTRAVAGSVGIAAALSRPLFSEAIFPKDDLYVTSFIAAAVLALAAEPMKDRLGPWRMGVAMGFVFASKYTALLACPVFLFMIDAPFRARWKPRHWIIAIACAGAMGLPWYLRNILLTGNPLYPVDVHLPGLRLNGLFGVERDRQLRTAEGIWTMLASTYHSLPTPIIAVLGIGWFAALVVGGRRILREPLVRAATIGSAATFILFIITSPHHEVRYIFPLMILWYAAIGLTLGTARRLQNLRLIVAGVVAAISILTVLEFGIFSITLTFAGWGAICAMAGLGYVSVHHLLLAGNRSRQGLVVALTAIAFAVPVYIHWHASLAQYEHDRFASWEDARGYPEVAPIWTWVNDNIPPDATIAYANTFFVYPYYGEHFTRRVVYAPVRKNLHDFAHFPRMGDRIPGDLIVAKMTEVMNEDPDFPTWLGNLHAMRATYLVIIRDDPINPALSAHPPEVDLAQSNPANFTLVEQNQSGWVFKLK